MKVSLVDFMGSDKRVADAARVSLNQDDFTVEEASNGDMRLIKSLIENKHGTPFEHCVITFRIEVPIFVMREWVRHRWSSFNEMSGRYTKILPQVFVPKLNKWRSQVGKPMEYLFEPIAKDQAQQHSWLLQQEYENTWATYEFLLAQGVAKEQARVILPVGFYTCFYWTVNLRGLTNFLSLRTARDAMDEIREAADQCENIFYEKFPVVWSIWDKEGRNPL